MLSPQRNNTNSGKMSRLASQEFLILRNLRTLFCVSGAISANVLQKLKQVSGVEEAHALYGVYDFLIKVSANSIDRLREIIKYNLTQLVGIVTILTLMIVEH